jgi:crossover junction endodeoxyribonuclease RusA
VILLVRVAGKPPALAGRLEMRVTFYFADRRRADVSNRLKALEDALTHAGAYLDDSQIDVIHAERVVRRGQEECAVVLKEIAA